MYPKIKHIHFVGIGGIGMSGIAEVLLNLGYRVSGSDIKNTEITRRLERLGAKVYYGHRKENVKDVDVLVFSSAIKPDNPEIVEARERSIPVIPRAEMLAELMRLKYGIAVAGSHGKTTTTSMIATILGYCGMDPTVIIGGRLNSIGSNAKLGQGDFLVAETDESDGSFLMLSPTIAVITNIDPEHLDYYGDMEALKDTFLSFANKVPFYGLVVLCLDHRNIQDLIPRIKKRFVTYGLTTQADFQGRNIEYKGFSTGYDAYYLGNKLGRIEINMPGIHNVYNSLAAIAVAMELDLKFEDVRRALKDFSGIQRRFQIKGVIKGITIVDDYGHHPEEIKATLNAAVNSSNGKRIVVVFQPHRYTRTKLLFNEFVKAFNQSDILIITDIYPASEERIEGVSAYNLYAAIKRHGHKDVRYIGDKAGIVDYLVEVLRSGDLVITLGAGDIYWVGDRLMERLRNG